MSSVSEFLHSVQEAGVFLVACSGSQQQKQQRQEQPRSIIVLGLHLQDVPSICCRL